MTLDSRLVLRYSLLITGYSSQITYHPSLVTHYPSLITDHSSPITALSRRSPSGQEHLKVKVKDKQTESESSPEINGQDLSPGIHKTWPKVAIIVLNWSKWRGWEGKGYQRRFTGGIGGGSSIGRR